MAGQFAFPYIIVAVVGCQRSGTTLAGQILGSHPKAILLDEDDRAHKWFVSIMANPDQHDRYLNSVLHQAGVKYRNTGAKILRSTEGVQLAPNVTHVVLKVPNLTFEAPLLASVQPPCRVVYMVRDPRSVVASMAEMSKRVPMLENQTRLIIERSTDLPEFRLEIDVCGDEASPMHRRLAAIWTIKSNLQRRFADAGVDPCTIRYEDLVSDADATVRRICSHVGLAFDSGMLAHEEKFTTVGPVGQQRARGIDSASLGKWTSHLTPAQAAEVMDITRDAAQAHGYA